MSRKFKTFDLQVKESGDETPRIVAYASTFHREPDSYGDVIAKGAFEKSLARIKSEGRYLPLLYGHRMDDPMMNIGRVVEAGEDEIGLLIEAEFDMENPNAVKARRDVLAKTLCKLSFAYDVIDWGFVEFEDGIKATELRELEIYEVSLVPVPANHHAEVIDAKAGRRNSKADTDAVSEAISAIKSQLEAIRGICAADEEEPHGEEDGEKGCDGNQSKAEESQAELLAFYKSTIKESI